MFEQERTLSRLQQRLQRDVTLFACFLAGSFGRRDQDPYADLDVFLVYPSNAAQELAFQGRVELAESILPYVAAKTWENPRFPSQMSTLYANGSKIDLTFAVRDDLRPAPIFSQIAILKDTDDWAAELSRRSVVTLPTPPPPLTTADLIALDNRFWVTLWDVWRRLKRGDVDTPFVDFLDLVGGVLPTLLRYLPEDSPEAKALVNLVYGRDPEIGLDHLGRLLKGYLAARAAIVSRYRLPFTADTTFENSLQKLVDRH